jgi:hypothetical protein
MTEQDDIRWARTTMMGTDPMSNGDVGLEDLASELRTKVADRIAAAEAADAVHGLPRRASGHTRASASARSPWLAVAAAVVALVVGYAGLGALLPDPAWAVEQTEEGFVRVELSPVLGRGPNIGLLVEELEAAGVNVDVNVKGTWWPWESGRINGIGSAIGTIPDAFKDGRIEMDADLSDVGIVEHGNGRLVIDPAVFEGTVTINVGDFGW